MHEGEVRSGTIARPLGCLRPAQQAWVQLHLLATATRTTRTKTPGSHLGRSAVCDATPRAAAELRLQQATDQPVSWEGYPHSLAAIASQPPPPTMPAAPAAPQLSTLPVVCSSACRRWLSVSAASRSAKPSTCRHGAVEPWDVTVAGGILH